MKEFTELRRKAREKRDKAIAQARSDYAETLTKIATLEQDLTGKEMSSHRKISECIERVIPTDREFTTTDIMTALEALDPGRVWRMASIVNHLSRLRQRGLVRRVRKAHGTEQAVYARLGVKSDPRPFQDMTLLQVIKATLAAGPLRQTEIVVSMLEAGYDTTMTPQALRNAVGAELQKDKAAFVKVDGKWAANTRG
jgi:hypothetical protein